MRWLGVVARLVIGGVCIAAGALKLPDPAESVRAVRAYQLLPQTVVPTVGYALPVIELVVGLCLVVGLLASAWLVRGRAAPGCWTTGCFPRLPRRRAGEPAMSKKQSKVTREAGSRRAAELRGQQERDDRRRRNLIIGAAVAGALVIVVALVAALQSGRDATGESAMPPQGAVDPYAIPIGRPDAPVTLHRL
jgi:hypothetical protein